MSKIRIPLIKVFNIWLIKTHHFIGRLNKTKDLRHSHIIYLLELIKPLRTTDHNKIFRINENLCKMLKGILSKTFFHQITKVCSCIFSCFFFIFSFLFSIFLILFILFSKQTQRYLFCFNMLF